MDQSLLDMLAIALTCIALVNLVTCAQRRADRGSSDRGVTTDQLTAVSGGIDRL